VARPVNRLQLRGGLHVRVTHSATTLADDGRIHACATVAQLPRGRTGVCQNVSLAQGRQQQNHAPFRRGQLTAVEHGGAHGRPNPIEDTSTGSEMYWDDPPHHELHMLTVPDSACYGRYLSVSSAP